MKKRFELFISSSLQDFIWLLLPLSTAQSHLLHYVGQVCAPDFDLPAPYHFLPLTTHPPHPSPPTSSSSSTSFLTRCSSSASSYPPAPFSMYPLRPPPFPSPFSQRRSVDGAVLSRPLAPLSEWVRKLVTLTGRALQAYVSALLFS